MSLVSADARFVGSLSSLAHRFHATRFDSVSLSLCSHIGAPVRADVAGHERQGRWAGRELQPVVGSTVTAKVLNRRAS
jgi:hypothetical protein